jgi:thiol-disulfide isomerase/thioredoxin
VVVNVWESSCGPCRAEAGELVRASRASAGTAAFVGLNIRDRDPAPARAFVRANGVSYPQIYDRDGGQLLKFGGTLPLNTIPTTVVIDEHGRIAARIVGAVASRTLTQLVNDLGHES